MKEKRLLQALARQLKRHPFLYRFRYALIVRIGRPIESSAPAGTVPEAAPGLFHEKIAALALTGEGTFANASAIAFSLSSGNAPGPGIGLDSVRTLEKIYAGGAGICSDYTQAFLGLCAAARIACREWGLCESFSGRGVGHTACEIYSTEHRKWVFIDPFHSLYSTAEEAPEIPLSMVELIDLSGGGKRDEIALVDIDPIKKAPDQREVYLDRYFAPEHVYFLLENNDIFAQDPFLRLADRLPPPLLHAIMIAVGRYQRFHVYTNDRNRETMRRQVRALHRWRRRIAARAILAVMLLVLVVWIW